MSFLTKHSSAHTVIVCRELFLERHENISILFADICKFTEMTTTLSVGKLVETLNDLFGKFDDAADVS
jgi:class 3 adenylate cyclase